MMSKKKIKKEKLKTNIFIKIINKYHARVYMTTKSWNEIFPVLVECPEDHSLRKYGMIAYGNVEYCTSTKSFYGTDTFARKCYRGKGFGIKLYKALIMAAIRLRKMHRKRGRPGKLYFSPHAAVGSSTSNSAWRVYNSLCQRNFLKQKKSHRNPDRFELFYVQKVPKNFKPIYFEYDRAW